MNWSGYFWNVQNLKQVFGGSHWERKSPTYLKKAIIMKQLIEPFVKSIFYVEVLKYIHIYEVSIKSLFKNLNGSTCYLPLVSVCINFLKL